MAKKFVKQNYYSNELKREVVEKYKTGSAGYIRLGKEYGIPYHTISNWVTADKNGKDIYQPSQRGKNQHKAEVDYKTQVEILKKMELFLKRQQEIK